MQDSASISTSCRTEDPTVQIHAPHGASRTTAAGQEFLAKTKAAGNPGHLCVRGFDGESYASIPVTAQTVGLVPEATRAAR